MRAAAAGLRLWLLLLLRRLCKEVMGRNNMLRADRRRMCPQRHAAAGRKQARRTLFCVRINSARARSLHRAHPTRGRRRRPSGRKAALRSPPFFCCYVSSEIAPSCLAAARGAGAGRGPRESCDICTQGLRRRQASPAAPRSLQSRYHSLYNGSYCYVKLYQGLECVRVSCGL